MIMRKMMVGKKGKGKKNKMTDDERCRIISDKNKSIIEEHKKDQELVEDFLENGG